MARYICISVKNLVQRPERVQEALDMGYAWAGEVVGEIQKHFFYMIVSEIRPPLV